VTILGGGAHFIASAPGAENPSYATASATVVIVSTYNWRNYKNWASVRGMSPNLLKIPVLPYSTLWRKW